MVSKAMRGRFDRHRYYSRRALAKQNNIGVGVWLSKDHQLQANHSMLESHKSNQSPNADNR